MANAPRDENNIPSLLLDSSTNPGTVVPAKGNESTGAVLVEVGGGLPPSSFANPTAMVGLTPVNGVATTALRSDAAPPLDQAIAPTWTGTHIWSGAQGEVMRIEPGIIQIGRPSANGPAIEWAGNNSPWEFQTIQGPPGAPVVSTGNATTPGWGPILAGGSYTPTVTPDTNVTSATADGDFLYIQMGPTIAVVGAVNVTATAAGPALVHFSLPVAPPTFTDTVKLSGSGAATNGTEITSTYIRSLDGGTVGVIDWIAPNTQAHTMRFTAMYTTTP